MIHILNKMDIWAGFVVVRAFGAFLSVFAAGLHAKLFGMEPCRGHNLPIEPALECTPAPVGMH
ncbi:hypothetical protein [Biformimicrobium ophioploci]|uniref:hypothetical protein n=1 Tax=Biformimicrobium ophioploci TaxID=3036711 RepID=UPI002552B251|nr:hypothetical protein [Microbulbifer sp. NKW57]